MVKGIAIWWIIAIYSLVGTGSGFASSHDTLAMRGNIFTYRDHPLRFWDRADKWFQILGKPNRITESGKTVTWIWDSLGLQTSAIKLRENAIYVSTLHVFLADAASLPEPRRKVRQERLVPQMGFPGTFILQGIELPRKVIRFREVQSKLSGIVAFEARGWPVRSNAGFIAYEPDGFPVGLNTLLICNDKLDQPSKGTETASHYPKNGQIPVDECDYTFDELEIGAPGVTEWQ